MTAAVEVFLPGVPLGKERPRVATRGGKPRLYTPAKTARFEEALRWAARAAMGGKAPLQGPLSVHIRAALPVPASFSAARRAEALTGKILPQTRPDADNLAKAILDAGNRILYGDDRQIARLCVEKFYAAAPGIALAVAPCPASSGSKLIPAGETP